MAILDELQDQLATARAELKERDAYIDALEEAIEAACGDGALTEIHTERRRIMGECGVCGDQHACYACGEVHYSDQCDAEDSKHPLCAYRASEPATQPA